MSFSQFPFQLQNSQNSFPNSQFFQKTAFSPPPLSNLHQSIKTQSLFFDSFQSLHTYFLQLSNNKEILKMAMQDFLNELIDFILKNSNLITFKENSGDKEIISKKIQENQDFYREMITLWHSKLVQECSPEKSEIVKKTENNIFKESLQIQKHVIHKPKANVKSLKKPKSHDSTKLFLRLIPKTLETLQIMLKMTNFPRLELKVSETMNLKSLIEHLKKKWLENIPELSISLFPDEKNWLKSVEFSETPTNLPELSENYLVSDLNSAYDFPENHVLYIYYELSEKKNCRLTRKSLQEKHLIPKREEELSKFNSFHFYNEEKTQNKHLKKIERIVDFVGLDFEKKEKDKTSNLV